MMGSRDSWVKTNRWIAGFLTLFTLALASLVQGVDQVTYYHNDALGSPVAATDASGTVIWRESYLPHGKRRTYEARETTCQAGNCTPVETQGDEKLWYTGKFEETSVGLLYLGARWYDPDLGRFLSVDPASYTPASYESFNRYAYANNNPYRFVDPDGRDAVEIVYKHYQVNTGFGFSLPFGHAGVLLINNDTGGTKYYEYGRYDPNGKGIIGEKLAKELGNIRSVRVPDVKLGANGKPAQDSLNKIYDYLSKGPGKGYEVDATYHDGADFKKMDKYVQDVANDKGREKYSLSRCNCYDFSKNTIRSGTTRDNEL